MLLLVAKSVFILLLKQSGTSGSDTTCSLHSTTPWSWWIRDQRASNWRELKNKGWSLVDVPSQVTFNISNHCCHAMAPVHIPRLARAPSPWSDPDLRAPITLAAVTARMGFGSPSPVASHKKVQHVHETWFLCSQLVVNQLYASIRAEVARQMCLPQLLQTVPWEVTRLHPSPKLHVHTQPVLYSTVMYMNTHNLCCI